MSGKARRRPDMQQNPFGCRAPSNDHIMLNYFGVEATSAWSAESWRAHASVGVVRAHFRYKWMR